ncbi:MAG: G8 domain-containing protein, partial [Bacteroidales bacterium]|nr:G8 domain-containing protein [Bacteroidales bacterium]
MRTDSQHILSGHTRKFILLFLFLIVFFVVNIHSTYAANYSSVKTGNWNDPATWGSASVPASADNAVVNNGHTVTITASVLVTNLTVNSGGIVTISNPRYLTIRNGGTLIVNSGASIDHTGTGYLQFEGSYDFGLVVNGTGNVDIEELCINSINTLTISGSGSIDIRDDLEFRGDNATVINNLSGGITLHSGGVTGSNLLFNVSYPGSSNHLTNNGTIVMETGGGDGIIYFNGSNSTVTNNGTITFNYIQVAGSGHSYSNDGVSTFNSIDFNNEDLQFNNSGTVNQSGNFDDADGTEAINNLNGGIWNWSGSSYDPQLKLFCNVDGANTFNYSRGGNQTIIDPQDAYWHIELSGSGTKTASGSFDVEGNWTNHNVTFAPAATTITFNGNSDQTISKSGSTEYFNDLEVDKPSGLLILDDDVTVTTNLYMIEGNVNSNGNTFALSHSTPGNLHHTQGYVIGQFKRALNNTYIGTDYLFPVGYGAGYNPVTLNFANISNGNLTVEFIQGDPGENSEFPIDDSGTDVSDRYDDGYWTMTSDGSFASNGAYITLNATGFTNYPVTTSTRVLYRSGASWAVSGDHVNASDPEVYRDNYSAGFSGSADFGLGFCCGTMDGGEIDADQEICPDSKPDPFTNVVSPSGGANLVYQWQKEVGGGGWSNILFANGLTYTELFNLTQTTLYRRKTTSAVCGVVYSDTVTVTVGDNTDPVITTCPADRDVSLNAGCELVVP